MDVEIITIGDEILIGQIVDTNSAWMAQEFNLIGVDVSRIVTIRDDLETIKDALKEAASRADLVLVTGGLGPTRDDVTKKAFAEYFNCGFTFHQDMADHIGRLFARFGKELSELNRQQASLPSVCEPLQNDLGTAPGMWFEENGTVFVSMPGVPYEMKGIMRNHVLPRVRQRFNTPAIVHRTVLTTGMGESWLSERIADWEDDLPDHIKLAYLPSPGRVRLRLSAVGENRDKLNAALQEQVDRLEQVIPELIFGFDTDTLEEVVGKLLIERGVKVGTAESCTGGTVAAMLTSISGSSAYFLGSIVAYANEVKQDMLNVPEKELLAHGAVSEPVVRSMAQGCCKRLGTEYAVATSGIAGPTGGTDDKPVGTVWVAVAGPNGTDAKCFQFGDERGRNIERSAHAALNMLRKQLLKDNGQS